MNRKKIRRGKVKVEIRDDVVIVDGYVNAVERDSKVLREKSATFIEKIKAGAFRRALERAERTGQEIKVLLNHDYGRKLASSKEAETVIKEDTIGLRCRCEIRDAEVIRKAKEKKLSGWSFGFTAIKENWTGDGEIRHRDIMELELREVSILDDRKIPAYDGTSIEAREYENGLIELRASGQEVETEDCSTDAGAEGNYIWENRYLATRAGI